MISAADLRQVGYLVDDTTAPGYWTVTGLNQTWMFPADDQETAKQVYDLALSADNISLRTTTEHALDSLTSALSNWDTLSDADFKATVKLAIQVLVNVVRLTINRYTG